MDIRYTICGIEELHQWSDKSVTHIVSILDPKMPEPSIFSSYGDHERSTHRFHDIIDAEPGLILPTLEHVESILQTGGQRLLNRTNATHLLVHCHLGVSRSTAMMLSIMAQQHPEVDENELFEQLRIIRPQAWPNSLMIEFADQLLNKNGRLTSALARHYAFQVKAQPALVRLIRKVGRQREVDLGAQATKY